LTRIVDESRPRDSSRIIEVPEDFHRKMRYAQYILEDFQKYKLSVEEYKLIDRACDLIDKAKKSFSDRR